jgi:pyruvate,water dikinase
MLERIVFAMQEYLIVLDFSKADLVEGVYYARPLLEEIGERLGLNWIDVRYLLPNEIKDALKNKKKVRAEKIADRKKNFALILEDFHIDPYFGKEAVSKTNELLEEEVASDVDSFEGKVAYPGIVKGKIKVVTSAKDIEKFNLGDILVTRDTTTELTSIIKRSAAIVANDGSLLSHTAIVSREFKIPCLIQTNIATKVLKDGDVVEVDANTGIVKILKK